MYEYHGYACLPRFMGDVTYMYEYITNMNSIRFLFYKNVVYKKVLESTTKNHDFRYLIYESRPLTIENP